MKPFSPDMNDDELDDLFREASHHAAFSEGKEAIWADLEKKLDRPLSYRRYGLFLIFLLLFLGLGYWYFSVGRHDSPSVSTAVVSTEPAGDTHTPALSSVSPSSSGAKGESTSKSGEDGASENLFAGNPANAVTRQSTTLSIPVAAGPADLTLAPADKIISLPLLSGLSFTGQQTVFPFTRTAFQDIGGIQGLASSVSSPVTATEKATEEQGETNPPDDRKHPVSHWYVGLSLGPDWSGVSMHGWRTGISGGMRLGYRLNSRWGVFSGVQLEKKLYRARPGDYHPADNGWMNYDVTNIAANCTVIDVPINVEYTLKEAPDYRILVSGGISSFWMREESYTYHYKTASGQWDEWSKEMYGKNKHPLSVINVSAGFERHWNHFSVELEPYLKVPLKGIGYGKVNLYSTGVHITLKYGL